VGGEANFDSKAVLAMAPRLERLDLIESADGGHGSYAALFEAAIDPTVTGGDLVDIISISFGGCEPTWTADDLAATSAALEKARKKGVKVFAADGDSGSLGAYPLNGAYECVGHPVPDTAPLGVELTIGFPASSPLVTSVGGTELEIDGVIPAHGAPDGGAVTDQVVWNEPAAGGGTFGGGGGESRIFPSHDAPWQHGVGVKGMVHKPDVTLMAGSPTYFDGGIGTSGASPATAGAMAVVDSYLVANGAPKTGFLNPLLYELAQGPHADEVFYDVTEGSNDLYGLGCCDAAPGYDMASGLGSIRFNGLAGVLLAQATPSPSSSMTTSTSSAPTTSSIATPGVATPTRAVPASPVVAAPRFTG
jgi:kumamolisin